MMKKILLLVALVAAVVPCHAEEDDDATKPTFSVTPTTTRDTLVQLGQEALITTFTIEQQNLTEPVVLDIRGANRAMWRLEKTEVSTSGETVKLWYKPTAAGKHTGLVVFESEEALSSFTSVSLTGYCVDPANPPTITLTPSTLPQFTTTVGVEVRDTLYLSSKNCIDYVYASIAPAGTGFILGRSMLLKENDQTAIPVYFQPSTAGNYSAEITFKTLGGETKTMTVNGVATETSPDARDWATAFDWTTDNPLALLRENFEEIGDSNHNKTLKIDRWQNVVLDGTRPWWGYIERDVPLVGNITERCAKITGFMSDLESTDSVVAWLVTPPLDYKNAVNQIFTFRVRGDYMFENHTTQFDLYYIDAMEGKDIFKQKIEVGIPTASDQNGEWFEFHVDLTGQETIADTFFMAFRYAGLYGKFNSVTYYIDDVSWGRPDIPVISTDSTTLTMVAPLNTPVTSTAVTVTAKNLDEAIALKIGGNNASKFKLSTSTLDTAGGTFTVTFESDKEGVHEAYVKLSSRGAADKYLPMAVLAKNSTGLSATLAENVFVWAADATLHLQANAPHQVAIYTTDGRCIWHAHTTTAAVPLPANGHYIVSIDGQTLKMTVR